MSQADLPALVLTSSWRGMLSGFVTPAVLLALGLTIVGVTSSLGIAAIILIGLGLVSLASSVFDLPRETTISAAGISRRCVGRTHQIGWDQVLVISRAPAPVVFGGGRSLTAAGPEAPRPVGPLTAKVGRRKHLLADDAEDSYDYDHLRSVVRAAAPDVSFTAKPPHE